MAMQSQVYSSCCVGVAGDMATPDQSIYQAVNYTAGGTMTVGNFAFADSTYPATVAKAGGSALLGIVQRNLSYPNYTVTDAGSLQVTSGATVTIATKGDYWVQVTSGTSATVGQKAFANSTTGAITTGSASASVSGFVETPWKVKQVADGGMVLISNWDN